MKANIPAISLQNPKIKKCIRRQFTTAYTPQQNGVVESMSKILLERTKAMLGSIGLKKNFVGRNNQYHILYSESYSINYS